MTPRIRHRRQSGRYLDRWDPCTARTVPVLPRTRNLKPSREVWEHQPAFFHLVGSPGRDIGSRNACCPGA
ncbi:Uncharacterized protein HZ326_4212 [Fusarium oxysporum f. sp. albedinis]|nr:Uncharacterized protein HZ326_4212 [Fusarium oxysporum f. sp. albedinis]